MRSRLTIPAVSGLGLGVALLASAALAHPGHGVDGGSSLFHMLLALEHALPLGLAGVAAALAGGALWLRRRPDRGPARPAPRA